METEKYNDLHVFQVADGWKLCSTCGRPFETGYANTAHYICPDGWNPIETAPRGREVEVAMFSDGGGIKRAHFAQDLSGEEQPPFQGWFEKQIASDKSVHMRPIDTPKGWRSLDTSANPVKAEPSTDSTLSESTQETRPNNSGESI